MNRAMNSSETPRWCSEVLLFWFSELDESQWFSKDAELDEQIRGRFLSVHEHLIASQAQGLDGARALLAAVIVLDQFSRNLFRGSARAFAADPLARALAQRVIERGDDAGLLKEERCFLYMPFEHSEDPADQALAVKLFASLGVEEWTRFALAHQALIERFGRFPHRNEVLGRTSTEAEIAAMKEPMGRF